MEFWLFTLAAFLFGTLVGGFFEWNAARRREDALQARLAYIAKERQDAEHVIGALRDVIARGGKS